MPRIALTDELLDALYAYASAEGPHWRAKLLDLWVRGRDDGALRRIRNQLGPRGLRQFELPPRPASSAA